MAGCVPGQVSCPLLALAQGGCWQHREPGLLLVQSHTGMCQGHICRTLVVPPSAKGGAMASGCLESPGSNEISVHVPLFLYRGIRCARRGAGEHVLLDTHCIPLPTVKTCFSNAWCMA